MFKHLPLPTDGSPRSQAAMRQGLLLAEEQAARATAISRRARVPGAHLPRRDARGHARAFHRRVQGRGGEDPGRGRTRGRRVGVACEASMLTHDQPWEAITRTAETAGCDLIVMASHGRRGIKGCRCRETHKVLTHSAVPVRVLR